MDSKILKKIIFHKNTTIKSVLVRFSETAINTGGKGFGLVVDDDKKCIGVITDGDIRRALIDNSNFSNLKANDLMNKNPLTAIETDNLQLAETRMREAKVQCLVVKNKIDEVVGVIQIFE